MALDVYPPVQMGIATSVVDPKTPMYSFYFQGDIRYVLLNNAASCLVIYFTNPHAPHPVLEETRTRATLNKRDLNLSPLALVAKERNCFTLV